MSIVASPISANPPLYLESLTQFLRNSAEGGIWVTGWSIRLPQQEETWWLGYSHIVYRHALGQRNARLGTCSVLRSSSVYNSSRSRVPLRYPDAEEGPFGDLGGVVRVVAQLAPEVLRGGTRRPHDATLVRSPEGHYQ